MSEYSEIKLLKKEETGEMSLATLPRIAGKSIDEELKGKLKPAAFGGYSKHSVVRFAEEMRGSMEKMGANLEHQVKDLVAEKVNLSQECMLLRTQISDAEKRIAELKEENLERDNELQRALEEKNEKFQKLLEEKEAKLRNLEQNNKALQLEYAENREVQANLQNMKQLLEEKEQEAGSLAEQLSELSGKLEKVEQQNRQLEESLNQLQPKFAGAQDKIFYLEKEKLAQKEQLAKYDGQEQEQAFLKMQNENLRQEIASKEDVIKDLLEQMELQKSMFQSVLSRFSEHQNKMYGLLQEKTELQNQNVDLENMITFLTSGLLAEEKGKKAFPGEDVPAEPSEPKEEAEKSPAALFEDLMEEGREAENAAGVISIHSARDRAQDITKWIQAEFREKMKDEGSDMI